LLHKKSSRDFQFETRRSADESARFTLPPHRRPRLLKGRVDQLGLAASVGLSAVAYNYGLLNLVTGHNEIEDHAFENAAGAFQVLQNHSLNSGVSQS
jgi:hypothetical protein